MLTLIQTVLLRLYTHARIVVYEETNRNLLMDSGSESSVALLCATFLERSSNLILAASLWRNTRHDRLISNILSSSTTRHHEEEARFRRAPTTGVHDEERTARNDILGGHPRRFPPEESSERRNAEDERRCVGINRRSGRGDGVKRGRRGGGERRGEERGCEGGRRRVRVGGERQARETR